MNLRKKPFSISLQALAGVLIFSCLLAHPFSEAASSPPGDKCDYMLVLNTYTESAPWSSHIINSIVAHIDQVDNFEVYTENMNSLLMTSKKHKTGEIESFKNNLLREYGKNPPRMLVLLGAPIAVLRDFVKQTWPGVPLILCSEMDYIGPENAYLDRRPLRPEERLPLCDKAVSDNITLIRTPLYLRENVELMRRMIPGMDSLIFVGDGRYINQQADSDLRELLDREFPQIDYRFYSAHEMSTEALLDSLNRIDYSLIPAVMAAQNMERSAQYGVETAKSQHWPTLSLKGGRTRYESDNRSYWDDQIQLNIDAPLYQGGAVSARVRQAEGARAMASSMVDQARFDVLQKASVAQADWTGARGRMEAGKLQLENALRARDVYKNEYTLSKRSINDLLSVEQDVWQATSAKIMAEYDGWSSAINYASAVDNLMPMIGIEKNAAAKLPDLS